MTSVVESVWGPVTNATYSAGLLGYPGAAYVRLAAGTAVVALLLNWFKPSLFYFTLDNKVVPKKWSVTASSDEKEKHAEALTFVPWWLASVTAGIAFALFV